MSNSASIKLKPNMRNPIHMLAFGFGSGLVPKAPGTAGTLAAIIPWLWLSQLSLLNYSLIVIFCSVLGVYLCGKTSKDLGVHDHSGIVWDEFCGFWLTMIAVPSGWQWLVLGFALFRFFDIVKPWPINWLDKNLSTGLGIMLDDIVAGIFAWIILQTIVYFYLPTSLFSQLFSQSTSQLLSQL